MERERIQQVLDYAQVGQMTYSDREALIELVNGNKTLEEVFQLAYSSCRVYIAEGLM